ncbi:type 1 fimbrial protein [Citrobacter sp. Cb003]|uniref:fimbrial protein n=1 Tax=Citrobacter sp. Cb003 TaxID=2985005 RepID=UPI0025802415|nr:fimbrial protein [Citrobacter sp. Cb003]MDM3379287.1 type 1 fimbrial protein [Citrobacter sp. Cb003]
MKGHHKGNISSWMLALLVSVSPLTQADTDVEFSGILVADPCEVHPDSLDQIVDFRNIPSKTFINHDRPAPKRFSIRLKECDLTLGTEVSVTFKGTEDIDQTGMFAVTGTAKGIAIALESASGEIIKPGVAMQPAGLVTGDTQLNYLAYVSGPDHSKVREGDFESTVFFFLEYQ